MLIITHIVVGSQFLTTTDELWATSRSHIQLDGSRNVVTWTLPTGPPETQAITVDVSLGCRCPIMGQRLCPYHNMVELLNLTDSKGETDRPFAHMGAQNPADLLKNIAHMLESSRTSEQPVRHRRTFLETTRSQPNTHHTTRSLGH